MAEEKNELFGFGILDEGTPVGVYKNVHIQGCSTMFIDFDRKEVNGDPEAFVRLVTLWPHLLKNPQE